MTETFRALLSAIENKPFLAVLSVAISILAYSIYIRDTVKKDGIQPHPFSWLLWGFVTSVAAFAQNAKGAGPGVWVTAFTAATCFLIGALTLSKNEWQFSRFEWIALVLGVIANVSYALAKNPLPPRYSRPSPTYSDTTLRSRRGGLIRPLRTPHRSS